MRTMGLVSNSLSPKNRLALSLTFAHMLWNQSRPRSLSWCWKRRSSGRTRTPSSSLWSRSIR